MTISKRAVAAVCLLSALSGVAHPSGYVVEWGYVTSTGRPKNPTLLASNAVSVAAGVYAPLAAAVLDNGTVLEWCSDPSARGPVQELQTITTNRIVSIGGRPLTSVVQIALGRTFGLALRQTGELVTWGQHAPVGLSNTVAVAAAGGFSAAVRKNGTVVEWIGEAGDRPSYYHGQPQTVSELSNVVAVALGDGVVYNSSRQVALLRNGTVVQWGAKYNEELAEYARPPSTLSNVVALATSPSHTLALRSDGTVIGWGGNGQGQSTGVPSKPSLPHDPIGAGQTVIAGRPLTNIVAVAAAPGYSLALTATGNIIAWGRMVNDLYPAYVPPGLSNVVFIAAGESSCFAITTNKTVADAFSRAGPR